MCGRRSSAILSHLEAKPTNTKRKPERVDRDKPHRKNQTNTRRGQAKTKKGGEANNTKPNRKQRGGQNQQRKKGGAGGKRQAAASKKGKRGRPGRQQCGRQPQPSKPTWVSVQDVVLNKLRPSTQPSQPLPELSHFYQTHKHKANVLLMSLWFLLVCHALTQNDAESPVSIFLPTSQKRSQKHMSSQKVFTSRHGLFV